MNPSCECLFPEFNSIRVGESALGPLIPELTHGANGVETHAGFFEAVGDGVDSYSSIMTIRVMAFYGCCVRKRPQSIKKCVLGSGK